MTNKEIGTPTSGLTPEELAEAQKIRMNSSAEAGIPAFDKDGKPLL